MDTSINEDDEDDIETSINVEILWKKILQLERTMEKHLKYHRQQQQQQQQQQQDISYPLINYDQSNPKIESIFSSIKDLKYGEMTLLLNEIFDTLPPKQLKYAISRGQHRYNSIIRFDLLTALPPEVRVLVLCKIDRKDLLMVVQLVCTIWKSIVEEALNVGIISLFPSWEFGPTKLPPYEIDPKGCFSLTPCTLECWVKVSTDIPDIHRVGVICGNFPSLFTINWEIFKNGCPRLVWGKDMDWRVTDCDLRTGKWQHIAFVRESMKEFSFYLDGKLSTIKRCRTSSIPSSESHLGTWIVGSDMKGRQLYINKRKNKTYKGISRSHVFHGCIKDLRIWSTPRRTEEILNGMNVKLTGTEDGLLAFFPMKGKGIPKPNHQCINNYATNRGITTTEEEQSRVAPTHNPKE